MTTEHALHVAVAHYLRVALKPPAVWTSLDAGAGKMNPVSAARRKARGVQRGWPDVLVIAQVGGNGGPRTVVVGLELKTKTGRLSPEQRDVMQAFADNGAWYVLCRSVEEVEAALRWCKVPLHASVGLAA